MLRHRPPFTMPTHIPVTYAIRCTVTGYIKIGNSLNLRSRFSAIQSGCPTKLELLGYTILADQDEARKVEAELHLILEKYNVHGEWFKDEPLVRMFLSLYGARVQPTLKNGRLVGEPCTKGDRSWTCEELMSTRAGRNPQPVPETTVRQRLGLE